MSKLKTYKFSDLYKMSSGVSSKPEQAGHGSQFVSFKTVFNNYFLPDILNEFMDISEKEKEIYSIKKGDIFLTRTSETLNELGMSCVAAKDYPASSFSGFLKRLRPTQNDITYDKFMAFYLRSNLFRKTMTNNSIMTLRASLNEQIFSYLELILPDYNEQKKAGDFLYAINAKIELNNRINTELEAMAKTLYDYWFIQFDFPDANGKPYKTSGGKMVWNEDLKREIPEGWEMKNLGDLINIFDSKRIPLSRTEREKRIGDIPYYGATSIMGYVDEHIFNDDYILLAEDGSVMDENGFPIVQFIWGKTWVNNHAHVIQAKNIINNEFVFHLVKTISVVQIITGSIQLKINQENLRNVKVILPDENTLKKFSKFAIPIRKKLINCLEENQELSSLRDWLLPMLMNGQVSVGEVIALRQAQDDELGMVAEGNAKYGKE